MQTVHALEQAKYAWQWTGGQVIAHLCIHKETKENCFSQDEGISPKLQEAVQPVHLSTFINWLNVLGRGPVVRLLRLFATTPKERKL